MFGIKKSSNPFFETTIRNSKAPASNSVAYSVYNSGCRAELCLQVRDFDGALDHIGKGLLWVDITRNIAHERDDVVYFTRCLLDLQFKVELHQFSAELEDAGAKDSRPLTEQEKRRISEIRRARLSLIETERARWETESKKEREQGTLKSWWESVRLMFRLLLKSDCE